MCSMFFFFHHQQRASFHSVHWWPTLIEKRFRWSIEDARHGQIQGNLFWISSLQAGWGWLISKFCIEDKFTVTWIRTLCAADKLSLWLVWHFLLFQTQLRGNSFVTSVFTLCVMDMFEVVCVACATLFVFAACPLYLCYIFQHWAIKITCTLILKNFMIWNWCLKWKSDA